MRPVNYTVSEMDNENLIGHHIYLAHTNDQLIAHLKATYGEEFEVSEESRSPSGRYTDLVVIFKDGIEEGTDLWVQCTPEKEKDDENVKY